jgi:hypothetical protein
MSSSDVSALLVPVQSNFSGAIGHFQNFERCRGSALREQRELLLHIHALWALALGARPSHVVLGRVQVRIVKACQTPEDGESWNADAEGLAVWR